MIERVLLIATIAGALLAGVANAATLPPRSFKVVACDPWGDDCKENEQFHVPLHWMSHHPLALSRGGGRSFSLQSVQVSGYLSGIMLSGSTPNPLPHDGNFLTQEHIDVYNAWLHAGGDQVFPFFRISGYRDGKLAMRLDLSGDSFGNTGVAAVAIDGGPSNLAIARLRPVEISFGSGMRIDELVLDYQLPQPFKAASHFDVSGRRVGPSEYSCYYGCVGRFRLESFTVAPVPVPASVLGMLACIGGLVLMRLIGKRAAV
jgi:hypothetical protein